MNWLDKFFLPGPIKKTLAEIRAEEIRTRHEIDREIASVFQIMRRDLETAVAGNQTNSLKRIKHDHLQPKHLAHITLADVVEKHILSGNYHLSKGRMTLEGQALVTVWNHVIDKIEKAGFVDRDRIARIRRDLFEKIMQVG
jgi:hypothetical protein